MEAEGWLGTDTKVRRASPRVLVIQDDERVADVESRVLEGMGVAPDVATDPRRGIWLAMENDYDLITVNWTMPYLDGVQVVRRVEPLLRQWTPFLFDTGHGRDAIAPCMTQLLDRGTLDVLFLPFTVQRYHGAAASALAICAVIRTALALGGERVASPAAALALALFRMPPLHASPGSAHSNLGGLPVREPVLDEVVERALRRAPDGEAVPAVSLALEAVKLALLGMPIRTRWSLGVLRWRRDYLPIVIDPPVEEHRDAEGRPHASSGPAIRWADGYCVSAMHGREAVPSTA